MKTAKIYPKVHIENGAKIGEYVIIGVPSRGKKPGDLETFIGKNAVIRSHSIIYAGNKIGDSFETGHYVLVREENKIGNGVHIGTSSVVEHHVLIGNDAHIHSRVFIPEYSVLEQGCWIGPGATLTNTPHPLCSKAKECLKAGLRIKKFAKIGANVTLLPHIVIGEYAVIGAGSVIVEDVPDKKVAVGNPGKVIKSVLDLKCRYGRVKAPYTC